MATPMPTTDSALEPTHHHNSLHFNPRWRSASAFSHILNSSSTDSSAVQIPHHSLRFSTPPPSLQVQPRQTCSGCSKSRRGYCLVCCKSFIPGTPRLDLPVKLEIIQHKAENPGTSSAGHLKIMAPESVEIMRWGCTRENKKVGFRNRTVAVPEMERVWGHEEDGTVVLMPGPGSTPLGQLRLGEIKRIVIIDSNWTQALPLLESIPGLRGLRRVSLGSDGGGDAGKGGLDKGGLFWRYKLENKKTRRKGLDDMEEWFSTAEAGYLALCELVGPGKVDDGGERETGYDDLLWSYLVQQQEAAGQMGRRFEASAGLGEDRGVPRRRRGKRKGRRMVDGHEESVDKAEANNSSSSMPTE